MARPQRTADFAGLGKRLAALRNQHDLSQAKLAAIVGLAPASIALYELDRNRPALEQLVKLAEFFGVTTDALLGRADLKTDAGNAAAAIFRRLPLQKRKVALSMLHALEAD